MKKKLLLGLVLVTLALSTIGCGTENSKIPNTEHKNTETETEKDSSNEITSEDSETEEDTSKEVETESTTPEPDTNTESVPPASESTPTPPENNTENATENTPPAEDTVSLLPFEGIYWYLEEEAYEDVECDEYWPYMKEGRYFDGTTAYYYSESSCKVYEYKYKGIEDNPYYIVYCIDLYSNGEFCGSTTVDLQEGYLMETFSFGWYGGIYRFEKVDSFDGLFEQ